MDTFYRVVGFITLALAFITFALTMSGHIWLGLGLALSVSMAAKGGVYLIRAEREAKARRGQ